MLLFICRDKTFDFHNNEAIGESNVKFYRNLFNKSNLTTTAQSQSLLQAINF